MCIYYNEKKSIKTIKVTSSQCLSENVPKKRSRASETSKHIWEWTAGCRVTFFWFFLHVTIYERGDEPRGGSRSTRRAATVV